MHWGVFAPASSPSLDSTCLLLLQGDFICAEANLGNNHTGAPLLIMAIGQKALSWRQYAGQFPAPCAATSSVKGFGHFHPAVQAAAQKVFPCWMLVYIEAT